MFSVIQVWNTRFTMKRDTNLIQSALESSEKILQNGRNFYRQHFRIFYQNGQFKFRSASKFDKNTGIKFVSGGYPQCVWGSQEWPQTEAEESGTTLALWIKSVSHLDQNLTTGLPTQFLWYLKNLHYFVKVDICAWCALINNFFIFQKYKYFCTSDKKTELICSK